MLVWRVIECKIIYTVTEGIKVGLRVFGKGVGKELWIKGKQVTGICRNRIRSPAFFKFNKILENVYRNIEG